MASTWKRLAGPALVSNSAATKYTAPAAGAIAVLAAPLAWQATTTLFREYETRTLVKGNQGTIMLQATFGILMAVGMGASTLL